ncbi:unnamed protein product [Periconia digitata]|uniref:Uncharacterized protein n=1 Tax=Periconia digitata TaxID=1303443 RepID=A0A9W4U9H0_9PLEO|nr:unnamed protein product [Periconia digitata]
MRKAIQPNLTTINFPLKPKRTIDKPQQKLVSRRLSLNRTESPRRPNTYSSPIPSTSREAIGKYGTSPISVPPYLPTFHISNLQSAIIYLVEMKPIYQNNATNKAPLVSITIHINLRSRSRSLIPHLVLS